MNREPGGTARHIRVIGRVQGVGFRYACCRQARLLGVTGWVRNAGDGSVEIHAEGAESAVAALIAWCQDGPAGARVRDVQVNPAAETGAGTFEVRF